MSIDPDEEEAVFTDAKPRDLRGRWFLFLVLLGFVFLGWWIARDYVNNQYVRNAAQNAFSTLTSAKIDNLGSASINRQGDISILNADCYTIRNGHRRLFFKAEEVTLALDGHLLSDEDLRIMRVDLFRPEIFVRREPGGEWNLEWALGSEKATDDDEEDEGGFPPNGVHIHDGIINVTFRSLSPH